MMKLPDETLMELVDGLNQLTESHTAYAALCRDLLYDDNVYGENQPYDPDNKETAAEVLGRLIAQRNRLRDENVELKAEIARPKALSG